MFADHAHAPAEVTWLVYQQITTAYAHPDPHEGKTLLAAVTDTLRAAVPAGLDELATLGRTLQGRRDDVLAYFTHLASNGPTEAINGRLEALRRNALGFRNLINYRLRSLCTAEPSHSEPRGRRSRPMDTVTVDDGAGRVSGFPGGRRRRGAAGGVTADHGSTRSHRARGGPRMLD